MTRSSSSGGVLVVVVVAVVVVAAMFLSVETRAFSPHELRLVGDVPAYFDLALAYTNMLYSYAAYCPTASLELWNCKYCTNTSDVSHFQITKTVDDSNTNTFGYLGYNTYMETVNVVFRGTQEESLRNWITDLYFPKTSDYPGGAEVHSGFYDAYLSVVDEVNGEVNKLMSQFPNYQLMITGHSLGGALSALCAANLSTTYDNIIVYTFGEPRVGDQVFAEYYNSRVPNVYRLVNYHDIVPHLPPQLIGFQHETREIWYNGTYYVMCSATNGEDPSCSDSVSVLDYSITDHLDYFGVHETC